ncbi:DNA glycosylase AlkZ-like family protein [Nonomuraea rubra]|uniref:DNA glycosylase AlkZ-like family protein n=1 Tax=Nonomuraea rubra TaxID=46180 RepID=UPI0034079822
MLAHAVRSRVIPPERRKLVTRTNGGVLPTLLVDGYVAGVWRPAGKGIEVAAFHPLPGHGAGTRGRPGLPVPRD